MLFISGKTISNKDVNLFTLDILSNVSVKSDIKKRGEVYIESSLHVSYVQSSDR